MPSRLAKLYEKAWNETVNNYSDWKRNIVIEEPFGRHADEATREAILLAEKWYDEMEAIPSGHSPSNDCDIPF